MDYLIVSAATKGSRYIDCLNKQRAMYGERFLGFELNDRGSWEENTKIKPEAIRLAFAHSDVVLWVDADCSVTPPAELPDGKWDICTTRNAHPRHKIKTSAGFILFRNTPMTHVFLNQWEYQNRLVSKDHPAMIKALGRMGSRLKIKDMTGWLRGKHQINSLAPERGVYAG